MTTTITPKTTKRTLIGMIEALTADIVTITATRDKLTAHGEALIAQAKVNAETVKGLAARAALAEAEARTLKGMVLGWVRE